MVSIEEIEEQVDPALIKDYVLRSHYYLASSQHIVILAENETIILDYKGKIVEVIPIRGQCIANWG